MSGPLKLGLYILLGVIAVYVGLALVKPFIWILILGAIGLIVYGLVGPKSLGGGRRTLP